MTWTMYLTLPLDKQTQKLTILSISCYIFQLNRISIIFFFSYHWPYHFPIKMLFTPLRMPQKILRRGNFCSITIGGQKSIQNTTFFNLVLSQQNNNSPQFQIQDALWRYSELLSLFNRSLINMGKKMGMHENFETVNTDWHQLLNKTKQLVQVSLIYEIIL